MVPESAEITSGMAAELVLSTDAPSLTSVSRPFEPTATADSASDSNVSIGHVSTSENSDASQQVKVKAGSECAVQTLYEGPPKCECCKNWVEEYPDDLRMALEEEEQSKQKALVVRMRKNHGDGKALVLDSVVVQSESLKTTLGKVFEGYEGITSSLKKLVFKAPFHPFHYRWAKFKEIFERQKSEDPGSASYTKLLYDVLHRELKDTMAEIDDLVAHRVITYPLLWALFEPGIRVVAVRDRQSDRFFIVDSCAYNEEKGFLGIAATFVDWDGSRFGHAKAKIAIGEFAGTKAITELNVMPAALYPSREESEASAIARGRLFVELRGYHYVAYQGTFRFKAGDKEVERQVDGRIVVDAASYFDNGYNPRPFLDALGNKSAAPQIDVEDRDHMGYDGWGGPGRGRAGMPHPPPPPQPPMRHMPIHLTSGPPPPHMRPVRPMRPMPPVYRDQLRQWQLDGAEVIPPTGQKKETGVDLTEAQLLLCNTRVRGYSLKLKKWGEFEVDSVSEIAWNDRAFPNLMLPGGYKDLILSFVEGQTSSKNTFDDIVEGKGLGLIMLLVGTAGTGKTLTAEAVADKVQRPLYMLSAGELGQTADVVEDRLNNILQLTEKWEAVLLFDECDVFLQERSMKHLEHNEIVAVFLRVLEYYRGILFMTTNRAESIDRAFQSRIHLTLNYPELQADAKEHIWRQFVAESADGSSCLTDETFARLARLPLNGRQIKNIVKSAMLLATQQKKSVGIEQIQIVLTATGYGAVTDEQNV